MRHSPELNHLYLPLQTHLGGKITSVSSTDVRIELEVTGSILVGEQQLTGTSLALLTTVNILFLLPLLTFGIIFILQSTTHTAIK
jgi:hypothetical protein